MVTLRKQNIAIFPGLKISSRGKARNTAWDDSAAVDELLPGKKGASKSAGCASRPDGC